VILRGGFIPCKGGTLPIELIAQRIGNYSIQTHLSN